MDELGKALGYFITRDIFYSVGGILIAHPVLAILPEDATSGWGILLLLVAAYPIGYVAKEIFEALGFIVTGELYSKGPMSKWMKKVAEWLWSIHHEEDWREEFGRHDLIHYHFLSGDPTDWQRARILRSAFLVHMAGIMGSSFVLTATTGYFFGTFNFPLALAIFILAFLLFPFTYFHTMRVGKMISGMRNPD